MILDWYYDEETKQMYIIVHNTTEAQSDLILGTLLEVVKSENK